MREELSKLRAGHAEPKLLEGLTVQLDKAAGSSAPLRDVAHVVSKGRGLAVTVYEAAVSFWLLLIRFGGGADARDRM
jgi:ribosome recycling factor